MLDMRSKPANVVFSISLFVTCLICYVLFVLLFITPSIYHLDSLLYPDINTLKPTVAVSALTAIFAGATAAFVTRCIEQSLWLRMSSTNPGSNAITIHESHHLAQWSVSPLERILIYPFVGKSWLLKVGGILLFATAAINPVLLSGISQRGVMSTATDVKPNTVPMVTNRLDQANIRYRGGNAQDNPTTVAAVAAMANLTAPILQTCTNSACHIRSSTTALRAECKHWTTRNPKGVGLISRNITKTLFCSNINRDLCVTLVSSSPCTYANFTSGYHPSCLTTSGSCTPGAWSTLFGVWVNGADVSSNSAHDLQTIDCTITFGNITIVQNGTNPPTLSKDSFVRSSWPYRDGESGWFQMNRIYTEYGMSNSPYSFSGSAVGTGSNTIYQHVLGYHLLGYDANNDAQTVARQIENNFDYATLSAYARQANASSLVITTTSQRDEYVYNSKVLLILLIPFFATLVGAWGRWTVGDQDTVISYSPIEIARRGPVHGLPTGQALSKEGMEEYKTWKISAGKEQVVGRGRTSDVGFWYVSDSNSGP